MGGKAPAQTDKKKVGLSRTADMIDDEKKSGSIEMVARKIEEFIIKGKYHGGEKITETEICELLNVSRTPVREAFRLLESEGIITHQPQKGVHVTTFSMERMRNLFQIRAHMEVLSAKEAAYTAKPEDIAYLRRLNDQIRDFQPSNPDITDDLDRELHYHIAKIGRNQLICEFMAKILSRYQLSAMNIPFQAERIPHTFKEHEDIISALEQNNPELAESYMRVHFQCAQKSIDNKLEGFLKKVRAKKQKG